MAAGLADSIREAFGIEAELIAGGGGIFDVEFDGKRVYNGQNEAKKFPDHDVILQMIREY